MVNAACSTSFSSVVILIKVRGKWYVLKERDKDVCVVVLQSCLPYDLLVKYARSCRCQAQGVSNLRHQPWRVRLLLGETNVKGIVPVPGGKFVCRVMHILDSCCANIYV